MFQGLGLRLGRWSYGSSTPADPDTLHANRGNYVLSGQNVNLLYNRRLVAAQGSFTYTGQDATLLDTEILVSDQGSFALSGQDVTFSVGVPVVMTASGGTYTLTGQNATTTYTPARTLIAAHGIYTVTGETLDAVVDRKIIAEQAAFTLTGQSNAFGTPRRLTADQATYTYTGQAANLTGPRSVAANQGSYTYTGQNATLTQGGGAPSWVTVYDNSSAMNGTDDGDGNADLTLLDVIKSAGLTSSTSKSQARVTIRFGSSSTTNGVPGTFRFGQAATAGDSYDFLNTPATVTFASTVTPGPNVEYVSNAFTLPENWDSTKNYILAWYAGATSTHSYSSDGSALANTDMYYKAGNDAATVNKTGYTALLGLAGFLTKVEVST